MSGPLRSAWLEDESAQGQTRSAAGGGAVAARNGVCGGSGWKLWRAGNGCCGTAGLSRFLACNRGTRSAQLPPNGALFPQEGSLALLHSAELVKEVYLVRSFCLRRLAARGRCISRAVHRACSILQEQECYACHGSLALQLAQLWRVI